MFTKKGEKKIINIEGQNFSVMCMIHMFVSETVIPHYQDCAKTILDSVAHEVKRCVRSGDQMRPFQIIDIEHCEEKNYYSVSFWSYC